jgi:MFS superfamily sulfate permease-like transporter
VPPRAVRRGPATADWIAGLSIAGLLLPEAVAYASLAGLPPPAGIVALLAGLLCYGLIGNSRFAVVSATSSSAAVLLAATSPPGGALAAAAAPAAALAAGLVLLTGIYFVAAGLARLGGISTFIARPVLRGFTFGLALTIVIHQGAKIVGVDPPQTDLLRYTAGVFAAWGEWNFEAAWIGLAALALLGLLARWKRVPAALIAIVAGIALERSGLAAGVPTVGPIALELHAPDLPALPRSDWLRLGELAFAMALILYAESYGSIRSFALRHGEATRPNRDLIALGVANLASGLFQGMPVGAGYSATAANERAGAQSRWAAWIAAALILLLLLGALRWIERTPEPVLAAIVIHAVAPRLHPGVFRPYFVWQRDRFIVVAAVLAVILLGVLDGLLAAIAVSVAVTLRELSEPRVSWLGRLRGGHDYVDAERHPEAQPLAGLLIARPEEPLFFANAERIFAIVRRRVEASAGVHTVILSLEESADLDGTSIEALREFAVAMRRCGVTLLLARVKDPLRDLLRRVAPAELPPRCYQAWSVDDAVRQAGAAEGPTPA